MGSIFRVKVMTHAGHIRTSAKHSLRCMHACTCVPRNLCAMHKRMIRTAKKVKPGSHFVMDNLFNGRQIYGILLRDCQVTASGVFRANAGIPDCVKQVKHPIGSNAAAAAKGNLKVAVLAGAGVLNNMVIAGLYDQGPVYFGAHGRLRSNG